MIKLGLDLVEKKVAIIQSNYIPWKGYFDAVNMVDEFILYDDVQFTKRDWRNRNIIKTVNGLQWLTIPVETKDKYFQEISETIISDIEWSKKHWKTIVCNYSRAKYFYDFKDVFEQTYFFASKEKYLSKINFLFIEQICKILGISTRITWSMDYNVNAIEKNKRLIALCKAANATHYYSGPAAKCYLNDSLFNSEGIKISYFNYDEYPKYPQLYGEFKHGVTILDLIFNEGSSAVNYLKSFKNKE